MRRERRLRAPPVRSGRVGSGPVGGGCPRQRVPARRDCPCPLRPSAPLPSPVSGLSRVTLGCWGRRRRRRREGKGARLPPPPVGDSPLAGALGRGGGAEEKFAAAPSPPPPPPPPRQRQRQRTPLRPQALLARRLSVAAAGRPASMVPAGRRGAAGCLLALLAAASLLRLRAAGKERDPRPEGRVLLLLGKGRGEAGKAAPVSRRVARIRWEPAEPPASPAGR